MFNVTSMYTTDPFKVNKILIVLKLCDSICNDIFNTHWMERTS